MSTYLGQPLGYKSADTQTDRKSHRNLHSRFSTYEGDTSVPSGIQTFSETDVSASRLAKPKYNFRKKIGPAVRLIYYRKEPEIFSRHFIFLFSNCEADTSLPCGIQTFSEQMCQPRNWNSQKSNFWKRVCLFVFLKRKILISQEFSRNW